MHVVTAIRQLRGRYKDLSKEISIVNVRQRLSMLVFVERFPS